MSVPRRRVLRASRPAAPDPRRTRRVQRQRERLAKERTALARWMAKLKRAFHAMEKSQARITRLERTLSLLEQN